MNLERFSESGDGAVSHLPLGRHQVVAEQLAPALQRPLVALSNSRAVRAAAPSEHATHTVTHLSHSTSPHLRRNSAKRAAPNMHRPLHKLYEVLVMPSAILFACKGRRFSGLKFGTRLEPSKGDNDNASKVSNVVRFFHAFLISTYIYQNRLAVLISIYAI